MTGTLKFNFSKSIFVKLFNLFWSKRQSVRLSNSAMISGCPSARFAASPSSLNVCDNSGGPGLLELAYKWGGARLKVVGQKEGILSKNLYFEEILVKF